MGKVVTKKQIRRNRILRVLLEGGRCSLTDISKRTGISLPLVSKLMRELKREKIVTVDKKAKSEHVGRPPIMVELRGDAGYVIGIDLGHRNTNIVLINLQQQMIVERHLASPQLAHNPRVIDWLETALRDTLQEGSVSKKDLLGVGLSIPGIVRGREGISETYLNMGDTTIRDVLMQRFHKPVHIEHDAKAMALGERWFGAAKHAGNVMCLNVGWGIGLGILLDGKIYYGRDGFAGEFGHIQSVRDGLLCQCGKRGCLESVASGMAIGRTARERLKSGEVSKLIALSKGNIEKIDSEMVAKAALFGDTFSIEVLEEAGKSLGEGIAQLINLFNPDLIILGGRVAQAGQFLLNPVRAAAIKRSLIQLSRGVQFSISSLGPNAGALGVATLATRDIFEIEHLNPTAFV